MVSLTWILLDMSCRVLNGICSTEVMAASEPQPPLDRPTPVFLVREDGQCILPTSLVYPNA